MYNMYISIVVTTTGGLMYNAICSLMQVPLYNTIRISNNVYSTACFARPHGVHVLYNIFNCSAFFIYLTKIGSTHVQLQSND